MGGEKDYHTILAGVNQGSPPHGRGKDRETDDGHAGRRITPAWAGKRFWNRPWVWATSDHPRVGGEKFCTQRPAVGDIGSPPRGRGKDVKDKPALILRGITPAWAGKRCRVRC